MKLTFLGATQTVTGSKYLIEDTNLNVLIDCGLFQGYKKLRLRNWSPLPINAVDLDYVVLTHAHIDHSGYLPVLIKNGFKGQIICSAATYEVCKILLPDSGYLQEEDARRANLYGYTQHKPALPLYTKDEAIYSLQFFKTIPFGKPYFLDDELQIKLTHSGHILGSSFVTVANQMRRIVFSGDLGRLNDPMMHEPAKIQKTDYLILESTYGDRRHDDSNPESLLADVINTTAARGGTILIPAFAVGRTQLLLYYLYQLRKSESIPQIPIFLDSPMAINTTELLHSFHNEHKLSKKDCENICAVASYVQTIDESKQLNISPMPKIILSASGMASGGRILHHLKNLLGDYRSTILFTGFQAAGTRGDRLLKGEKEIKIHGELFPVKAQIKHLNQLSAHADYQEILTWLSNFEQPPLQTYITHGETQAANALAEKITTQFDWSVTVPEYGETVNL